MCADRSHRSPAFFRRPWAAALLSLAMACASTPVRAHNDGLSEASALSALPVAVSVTAPVMSVVAGSVLTLKPIDVVAAGTAWVLPRARSRARIV